ncbi:alkaline phosphatase family protein [Kitasatospora sp. NPDC101235]|uniref:alkaline phosphatase family protein n=1 Tax=Kitasatospora sp. NPDC101235 TaxID=3364101 RepID=UPI00381F5CFA
MHRPCVMVVGIDGVRLDLLPQLDTPHLDAVTRAGFLAPVEIDQATPTMSGPCWATVLTGVGVTKHGVWSNSPRGHRLDAFPDFTTRLAADHGRRTFAAGGWAPMFLAQQGGPLITAPSRLSYIAPTADTPAGWDACDQAVTAEAARIIGSDEDLDACFVYLGAVDETAHFHGCGPTYRQAVETADRRLGQLTAALRSRPGRDREDWTVIVVTDHGHRDEGGHGGHSPEERTAWVAACGPGLSAATPPATIRHADVAAHVYTAVGLAPDPHWSLDGTPLTTP